MACKTSGCDKEVYPGFKLCPECLCKDPIPDDVEDASLGPICHRDEDPALFFDEG